MIEVLIGFLFGFSALLVVLLFLNWFPEDNECEKDDFAELEWWRKQLEA